LWGHYTAYMSEKGANSGLMDRASVMDHASGSHRASLSARLVAEQVRGTDVISAQAAPNFEDNGQWPSKRVAEDVAAPSHRGNSD
jgi:hypothetical protein